MQNSKAGSTNLSAIKTMSRSPSKASMQSKSIKSCNTPRDTALGTGRSSNTSVLSRRTDLNSEDSPAKLKNKFTQPRMNRLTELRIKRLQNVQTNAANDEKAKGPSQRTKKKATSIVVHPSTSLQSSEVGDVEFTTCPSQSSAPPAPPCPPCLPPEVMSLRNNLEDLQAIFIEKVNGLHLEDHNISCKLVTLVLDGNCQLILSKEDLISLPNNIPVQSVSDFLSRCKQAINSGFNMVLEMFKPNEDTSEDLRLKLQEIIDTELAIIKNDLDKLCVTEGITDISVLKQQNKKLVETIDNLTDAISKLEVDIVDIRKNRDELKKALEEMHNKNKDLAIELADKNIAFVEQSVVEDDLRNEVKQLKKVNKIIQQRLKDIEDNREQSYATITDKVVELEQQLEQALTDKELAIMKSVELTESVALKDRQLAEIQKQLMDLEQEQKDWQDVRTEQSSSHGVDQLQINELQAKLAVNQSRLESMIQEEKQLRDELERRRELQTKAELKVSRLEESVEYHRQVLAVRGERINYLDREMKQREQESNRKLNEVMSQASDKNTIITQITNELASTNEQFQNLCSTLSIKQTKLHSQEHVIKLLEESNARSVKLHTKLGEKNALLKDELEHLRRTVKNLMLGSGVNDAEVKDILME
ncbi:putative leucine-rich repeat-containing protein DDB_G0290503 isoform X2 [Drosophila innubila]|uniref:putative leucine-rich repeat-containing protein DDB_G0290503 isoform X2 n=1 Tax=Drosophila innubila TaxID=198719 RepID=UPI00148BBDB5|nr:putative leucine-rich repeat-containing protein DDB_G0290503 isoform X2 [Drosophila innubila]